MLKLQTFRFCCHKKQPKTNKQRFMFSILVILAGACVVISAVQPPAEWQDKINSFNAFFAESDDGPLNGDGFPIGMYLPLIGNGYISHANGVRSDTMYISGVFNGETTSPSHRARIRAPLAVQVSNTTTTGVLMDITTGTYHRRGTFNDDPNSWYELRWYPHRENRYLYALEFEPHFTTASLTVKFVQNLGKASVDFKMDASTVLDSEAELSCGTTLIPETAGGPTTTVCVTTTKIPAEMVLKTAEAGHVQTYLSAFATSLDSTEVSKESRNRYRTGRDLAKKGALYAGHVAAWSKLWESGIEVTGRPDVAKAANASMFAILSSVRDDWAYGLAPGGLTNYYNGHSFWDTETWMYPVMLYLFPSISRSLMTYRFNRMDGARAKAKSYDPPFAGTMFPWESAFSGVETCPTFAATGLREDHINGDIAIAIWQEYAMRKDTEWLRAVGYPMLSGIADFWMSIATLEPNAVGEMVGHIRNVIPPDEYVDNVSDSVYTNYVAAQALRYAVEAANILNIACASCAKYAAMANSLVILFDSELSIHPEYEGYPGNVVKQADVVLLHYPLGMDMSLDVQKADLEYYSARTDHNGPAMTWGMHSIGYLDLDEYDNADKYFNMSFQDNMHEPLHVWTEVPAGGAVNFITGAGGFLQTLVMGYPGVRIQPSGDLLRLNPRCPESVTRLKLRGLQYLGNQLTVDYICSQGQRHAASVDISTVRTASGRDLFVSRRSEQDGMSTSRDELVRQQGTVTVKMPAAGEEIVIKAL